MLNGLIKGSSGRVEYNLSMDRLVARLPLSSGKQRSWGIQLISYLFWNGFAGEDRNAVSLGSLSGFKEIC